MKKNLFKTLILVASFLIVTFNITVFATFEDINNHWASETINSFVEKEYITNEEMDFYPDSEITKGELVGIVNKFFAYGITDSLEENLIIAKQKGYLSNANPEDCITREEIAILICKILSLEISNENEDFFIDSKDISEWAKGYVNALVKENIILGYPDNSLKPQQNITKAEFVTVLNRCIGIGGNDLEFIEEEQMVIEVGVLEYTDGKTVIKPINDSVMVYSGDKIQLALMLPENQDEENVIVEILDEKVVEVDTELYILTALSCGTTNITFKTENSSFSFFVEVK